MMGVGRLGRRRFIAHLGKATTDVLICHAEIGPFPPACHRWRREAGRSARARFCRPSRRASVITAASMRLRPPPLVRSLRIASAFSECVTDDSSGGAERLWPVRDAGELVAGRPPEGRRCSARTFVARVGDDALAPLAAAGDLAYVEPDEPVAHGGWWRCGRTVP